jgi:hypothetical protein
MLRFSFISLRHSQTEKFACGLAFKIEKKPQQCNCSGAGVVELKAPFGTRPTRPDRTYVYNIINQILFFNFNITILVW